MKYNMESLYKPPVNKQYRALSTLCQNINFIGVYKETYLVELLSKLLS